MPSPWRRLASREVHDCRIYRLRADRNVHPLTATERDYYVIDSADWVNVIATTVDRKVILIEQFRHGTGALTLEIPGGMVDAGEDPVAAGLRELSEETGFGGGTARLLGHCEPNPAIQNNRCWFVAVDGVAQVREPHLDDGEDIDVHLRPLADVPGLIERGDIRHALVIAAFQRWALAADGPSPAFAAGPT